MRKFWMFLAAGAFAFGLLTSQALAKDLDKIDEPLDRLEALDKARGVHVDLPANVGAGANRLQGIQNRTVTPRAQAIQNRAIQNQPAAPAAVPDAPFSHFPHAPGVDHG